MTRKSDSGALGDGEGTVVGGRRSRRPSSPPDSEIRSLGTEASGAAPDTADRSTGAASVGGAGSSGSTHAAAVAEVMAEEEGTRARGFSIVIAAVSGSVGAALPFIGGDPLAKRVAMFALAVIAAASVWLWSYLRPDPARYTRRVHRLYGAPLIVGVVAVEYFFGFFSPVVVIVTLGVFYFGQTASLRDSVVMPLFAMGTYALGALLTAFGIVEDRGLFPAHGTDLGSRLFAVVAILGVLAITLRMARVGHASMHEAVRRSNEALLLAQRQEAQLAEAHHQLDRALKFAIGKPGRYTGIVAGEHELGVVIGIGAMGEVYEASHVETQEPAAVKLMHADAMERESLVDRFLREGEICGKLRHPNLVRVLGVGRLAGGEPYMTMERLEGRDLAARLREEGQLGVAELAKLAKELGAALQHAHEVGVVHRDLKPLNVYEARDAEGRRRWKILDFGISKLQGSTGTLTRTSVVGTPGYMSPEQARGSQVDRRSDVFAMGVVLYRAMTGRPAFGGKDTPQVLFDVVYRSPARPSSVADHIPRDVDAVMAIALAKEPDERFDSAWDLARAFRAACSRRLEADLRSRGKALMRKYPWGSTLTPEDAEAPKPGLQS